MSKLDWFTILVIAVCILAIGALIWNAKNLYQGSKNPADTEISENFNDGETDLGEDDEYDVNIDGDADGDNAVTTNGTSSGNADGTINYDSDIAREAAEADAEEARMAEREAAEAAARENSAVSERINTNTSPSSQSGINNGGNSSATAARRAATSSSKGAFMVIIGSYRAMVSAERMLRSVKAKGYGEARIKKFDNGTFARVLVGRRKSLNSARDLQAELVSDGFKDVIIMGK